MSPPADEVWSYYYLVTGCTPTTPPRLLLYTAPVSLYRAVLINVSAVRKGGNEGGGKTSQYKVAFKISAPLKAIPP